jgi:hypothetical protein
MICSSREDFSRACYFRSARFGGTVVVNALAEEAGGSRLMLILAFGGWVSFRRGGPIHPIRKFAFIRVHSWLPALGRFRERRH